MKDSALLKHSAWLSQISLLLCHALQTKQSPDASEGLLAVKLGCCTSKCVRIPFGAAFNCLQHLFSRSRLFALFCLSEILLLRLQVSILSYYETSKSQGHIYRFWGPVGQKIYIPVYAKSLCNCSARMNWCPICLFHSSPQGRE